MEKLRLLIGQQNPIVGDIQGNVQMAKVALNLAGKQKADLVVLSELFLSGYPPEDLLLNPSFIRDIAAAVETLAAQTSAGGAACLVGAPFMMEGKLFNAALLLEGGRVVQVATKKHLPNYGVFDEARLFAPGKGAQVMDFRGVRLGVLICEDVWQSPDVKAWDAPPDMLIVLNGSPYEQGKAAERLKYCAAYTAAFNAPLVYVNQVGGQDDLVFDGASFVLGAGANSTHAGATMVVSLPLWESENRLTVWEKSARGDWLCVPQELLVAVEQTDSAQEIYQALVLGVRDYVRKNNFTSVLLGLSGGIDSALVAALACDALGAAQVHCIALPSRFSSKGSLDDARACAQALGARLDVVDIEPMVVAGLSALSPLFGDLPHDLTEENIQSRLRGLLLMAVSNKFGAMLLTTGNKSEMSVGYATLYGDMNGGFNPLKDVYKTEVFALAKWRNQQGDKGAVIPRAILEKPPSAELRADQKDEDSLPPYDKLDDILRKLIDEELPLDDIVATGHAREVVHHIDRLVRLAEYKRRQSAPGVRVGKRYFGKARRYPITNAYGRKNDG